jgi:hypothetical protein
MPKLRIQIRKEVWASYEVTVDTDDAGVAQLEKEKLRNYEYEKSLHLEWDFETWSPEVISVDDLSSEETLPDEEDE